MPNLPSDKYELTTLQNQLLLAVGGSLDAHECMRTFMQTTYKLLDLDSISLFTFDHSTSGKDSFIRYISIPDDEKDRDLDHKLIIYKMLLDFKNKKRKMHLSEILHDTEILAYAFSSIGGLVLVKKQSIFPSGVKTTLIPVIDKAAEHFQLCEQQKRTNKELKINKKAQLTYELQAKRDPLTNLPNRREFRNALSKEISNAQRYNHLGALMYIDLDNFKTVNDSLGHSIGDILLTHVARRLTEQARGEDRVFRIGGDEFVYILVNTGNSKDDAIKASRTVANRVINCLSEAIQIDAFSLHITPSIGIAIFPETFDSFDDGNDSENILRHADTAMYRAKEKGRNCYKFFNPEMHVEVSKRLIIEEHLRKAINNDELHVEYQPIVNSKNEIIAAESLARWDNPMFGSIPPEEFISISEESNMILKLSELILRRACTFAATLYQQLPKDSNFSYISINISPRQFLQNDFVESVISIIEECSVPNEFIKLEFTETVLLDNLDATIKKMKKLNENNIDFLLDDFGTGYSSLSYLHKLPIWLLKIDKSFVNDIHADENDTQAILSAILILTEKLGIKCIVEGVETQQQVDYFKSHDIHGMQGYFFYKPMLDTDLIVLVCNLQKSRVNE